MILKKLKYISLIVFMASVSTAYAQIEIKNKIVDFTSLLPLSNASIYVKNTTIGTVSNADGNFVLLIPQENEKDTLVVSSIGYKTYKVPVNEFDNSFEIFLEDEVAALDEIILIAENRPKTGNDIVIKALEELTETLPDSAYIQKGFLRHKERNTIEFKWLIESALTVYDSGYASKSNDYLKVNIDQVRKSYDLRDVDSVFSYVSYKNQNSSRGNRLKIKDINRNGLTKAELLKSIKWNDTRVNGLQNLFQGKLNLLRNANTSNALFGKNILATHQFKLDTILVDNERKLYKIEILKSREFIDLKTKGIFNGGYQAKGWLYIYYDNYAFKKIEYELVAASDAQKVRSKRLFNTQVNHKLIINYIDYKDKMYPSYVYYETPKLVNVGLKSDQNISDEEKERYNKEERYYTTVQELLFSEIILDKEIINLALQKTWDMDIFSPKPYNKDFWKSYNVLLESEEDEILIEDLSKRATLFKE